MPKLTINGKTVDVENGKRLVRAIEDAGVNIGHRCGGYAKCTTCRVVFVSGEPSTMTAAEYERLNANGLYGQARLSCQIIVDHDMEVEPLITAENTPTWDGDTGPTPEETVTPESNFLSIEELDQKAA